MRQFLDTLLNGPAHYTIRHNLSPGMTLVVVLGSLLAEFITGLYISEANAVTYYNNERIHTSHKMAPRAYAKTLRQRPKILSTVFGKKVALQTQWYMSKMKIMVVT